MIHLRLFRPFVLISGIVLFIAYGVTDALARSQRMGIPKGTVATLAPKSSKSVGAFCLDYHRPAPSADTQLGHVLTAGGTAMVQVAGQSAAIPLSQAIADGIVRVGGRNLDPVQEMLGELDEIRENPLMNLRVPPELMNPDWFQHTPDERMAFVRSRLEQMVAAEPELAEVTGDFRNLELINLTDQEITVKFTETTVLSEAAESIPDSRIADLRPLREGESAEALQIELWVRDSQRQLRELAFFDGKIDGVPSEHLRDAELAFRKALDIDAADLSDAAVAELRARASILHQEAVALGTSPPPKVAVRIEQLETPPPALILVTPHAKPKGARNAGDLGDFVDALVAEAGAHKYVELDLSGFSTESQADLDALATTIRIQLAAKSPETRSRFSGKIDPELLARIGGDRAYPKGPVFDPKTQRWTMETLLIAKEPLVVKVWGKTRDALIELYRAIHRILLQEPDLLLLSQEDMARALRKSLEKDERQIEKGDIELTALGRSILVEHSRPSAKAFYWAALP